jgi:hypothetical protein
MQTISSSLDDMPSAQARVRPPRPAMRCLPKNGRRMAEAAVRRFQGAGIPLNYRLGPPDSVQAVDEEFKERTYDEVLVSTYAPRRSRWLAMKFPDKVEDKYKIPVRHVEASPDFLQNLGEFGPYG